jgi:hypothetical protein
VRVLARAPLAALVAVLLLGGTARADVPASSLSDVQVSRSGNTLTVTGTASIADASTSVLGTDATGDAAYDASVTKIPLTGLGLDITSAKVERKRSADELWFSLGIADPMTGVFTLPEVTHYHWLIRVTNGSTSVYYLLQAMRSGQYDRQIFPSADPLFRVNACGSLASGAPSCFNQLALVQGQMANGVVQWKVPVGIIGAFSGALIQSTAVYSTLGASGASYFSGPGVDTLAVAPYVMGPAVAVDVRDAQDTETAPTYPSSASLGPDGSFVAKLAAPTQPGDYIVSVRACDGDTRGCAVTEVPYTIS